MHLDDEPLTQFLIPFQGSINVSDLAGLVHVYQHDASRVITEQQRPSIRQIALEVERDANSDPPASDNDEEVPAACRAPVKRRKVVGGLRLTRYSSGHMIAFATPSTQREDEHSTPAHNAILRQLQSDARKFPQRRRAFAKPTAKSKRSASILIASIRKNVYGPICVEPPAKFKEVHSLPGWETLLIWWSLLVVEMRRICGHFAWVINLSWT